MTESQKIVKFVVEFSQNNKEKFEAFRDEFEKEAALHEGQDLIVKILFISTISILETPKRVQPSKISATNIELMKIFKRLSETLESPEEFEVFKIAYKNEEAKQGSAELQQMFLFVSAINAVQTFKTDSPSFLI